MRVMPSGEGSEFVFTLIRRPGMSDVQFAQDKAAVENDLETLKALLERRRPPLGTLFVSQRLHRVHARRAAGRDVGGERRHREHDRDDDQQRHDIALILAARKCRAASAEAGTDAGDEAEHEPDD